MIGILKTGGHTTYNLKEYVVDIVADIDNLPVDAVMGSTAFVIETGDVYMINSSGEWVKI